MMRKRKEMEMMQTMTSRTSRFGFVYIVIGVGYLESRQNDLMAT